MKYEMNIKSLNDLFLNRDFNTVGCYQNPRRHVLCRMSRDNLPKTQNQLCLNTFSNK